MKREKKDRTQKDGPTGRHSPQREPIAIVGIGCRYPGASNAEELWQNLRAGRESIIPYPGDRFAELDSLYARVRNKPGRLLTDRGGFLPDVTGFDSQFFEISPRESIYVDPQHRLLLEVAWEALENAGQVRERYENSATGVYIGLWTKEYENRLYESSTEDDFYSVTGCGSASASGRLSYTFGFQGPSLTIDTACSSSLVAVHMACESLWAGDIDMGLAGGANLILGGEISELFTKAHMLSPEGSCKFGDESANGFVRSEGAGIVVLKTLSRAHADRDPIYAVIRGGAVNNDGRSSGFMVTPSRQGQKEMLKAAWKSAAIEPEDLSYIEMHGTGTAVGDPVEVEAVGAALVEAGVQRPCPLGSIKTNIGHTETAAGVGGLIKVALSLQHRVVPPSLHFRVPNPRIAWEMFPVRIATEPIDLSGETGAILAGVSSFGLSGTNVHLVLEEITQSKRAPQGHGPYLLPISARSSEALDDLLRAHLEQLRAAGPEYPIRDVCYTASVRRNHHEYRVVIIAEDVAQLEKNLVSAIAKDDSDAVIFGRAGAGHQSTVFVAPGQGSQWLGMASELFHSDRAFRQAFEECDVEIHAETGWSLIDRVIGAESASHIKQIDVIQPSLFAMSVALAAMWQSWGVAPDAVVGHSMGEVAAAYIAGILDLKDAVAIICRRSRLMKTLLSGGSMATVELPMAEVESQLQSIENISVAASNGPHTTVISGDAAAIESLLRDLTAKDIYCRQIKVDVASHSAKVDPILDALLASLGDIRPQPARIPMLSTVTGKYAVASNDAYGEVATHMDPEYWVQNLRQSVLFAPGIQKLCAAGNDTFVELSPHPILLPSIEASAREVQPRALAVPSLRREKPAVATMLAALGTLYVNGRKIAWERFYPEDARCVTLPQYPFQRERCWPEPADPNQTKLRAADSETPLLGHRFESSLEPNVLLWEADLQIASIPYLNDHRVLRSAVFPATGHLEMALSAAKTMFREQAFEVRNAVFVSAAYLPDKGSKTFQLALTPDGNGSFAFAIRSRGDQGEPAWPLRSYGILHRVASDASIPDAVPLSELQRRFTTHLDAQEHYARTAKSGLQYGPAFQLVQEVWVGEGETVCRLRSDAQDAERDVIHPTILDACLQAMAHVRPQLEAFRAEDTYLPVTIEQVSIYRAIPAGCDLFSHARLTDTDAERGVFRTDLQLLDAEGNVLVDVAGMELQRVAREESAEKIETLYSIQWVVEPDEGQQVKAETAVALLSKLSAENWVMFADDAGIADAMKETLELAGGKCTTVRPGLRFHKTSATEYEVNPADGKDLFQLFEAVNLQEGAPTAVVHLWSLSRDSHPCTAEYLMGSQAIGSQSIPQIVQAIGRADWRRLPRLWIVTHGTAPAGTVIEPLRIEDAPLWGIGRSIAREHPELRPSLVDLSAELNMTEARALALRICSNGNEDRIALREHSTYVARIVPFITTMPPIEPRPLADGEAYRIEILSPGILDNLSLRACTVSPPRAGEVTLEVMAAGMNFIDVTKVMGIYPGLDPANPIQLGIECAGRITAIGDGVHGFHVGDEVLAITPSMRTTSLMSSSVSLPAEMVIRKPGNLTLEQAATAPIAYLTAYYSLVELAHIRRDDWVLIHAAAGGVGLAAIEIAQWAGAKVIATVGSSEKEEYVRSLGITHVFNSRSLTFASGVMEATQGRGVDIVLNSLTGELQTKGLEVLAPYGRFIELGKRDIYDDRPIGLKVFRKNLSFHAVDLAAAIEERRPYIVELLRTVMQNIENGAWRPLPVQSFSGSDPSAPFHFMAQARHVGKIAIRMDRDALVLPPPQSTGSNAYGLFSSNATYLVTGGLGGVALTVAEWMAKNGAGHLVLLSRRVPSEDSLQAIRRMEASGATVFPIRADVTSAADIATVLDAIHSTMPPLKGIMHTAAVVDDALVKDLSPKRFVPVMMPKIVGAWNLHESTLQEDLDFFVLFSSIGAVHPQPGMGSYAAANAFLDAFAYYRRSLGRPAITVNWGGWDQIGLARAAGTGRSIDGYMQEGMRVFSGEEGTSLLRRALESNPAQVLAVPIDANQFAEFHGADKIPPAFSGIVARTSNSDTASTRSEIVAALTEAESIEQRQELLESYLQEVLGKVLKLATRKIDRERPLGSMGLDSLMGLEFVRRLSNALQIAVPATVVFNYPTIQQLATHLLRRLQLVLADELSVDKEVYAAALRSKDGRVQTLADGLTEEDALQALVGGGERSS
jgi:acyl transferase domain-containing protein/NADPH:quinone reductase-like Zn-dependent oxidoreductase/NADP-dependent 3-hydroxy acid dehydrogenase YdfG/acyl carrier protein